MVCQRGWADRPGRWAASLVMILASWHGRVILVDTRPIVAVINDSDNHHRECAAGMVARSAADAGAASVTLLA